MLVAYLESFITSLRCLQEMWSRPRVDKLLYFITALIISALEKEDYSTYPYEGILSRRLVLIGLF